MSQYLVRPMRVEDIEAVSLVERECFTTPWPTSAYRRELRDNRMGRYIVLTEQVDPEQTEPAAGDRPADESGVRRAVGQLLRPFARGATSSTVSGNERIVGFAGMWLMLDEAHVTTIGVKADLRGKSLGEVLFASLMQIAQEVGAQRATLEVRVSNFGAQALYRKYGFNEEGVRKRYYSDDNEDALIMWSERFDSPSFQERYQRLRSELATRVGDLVEIRTNV